MAEAFNADEDLVGGFDPGIAAFRLLVLAKVPRWRQRRVRIKNQHSTRFSQEALVGVKCRSQRGRFVNQSCTSVL